MVSSGGGRRSRSSTSWRRHPTTGDKSDVDRSIVRAKIVAAATGLDAYAVVAAVRLDSAIESRVVDDAEEYLKSDRGSVAFWYEIVEEDLEPPSPR